MAQLKKQLFTKLEGDDGITAKLGDGVNSIMPAVRSGDIFEPSSESATPFMVVKVEEMMTIDAPVTGRLGFSIWIYDQPGKSFWAIDRIVKEVKELFESRSPQFTADTGENIHDHLTEWEYTSGELYDEGLQMGYKYVRFGIHV